MICHVCKIFTILYVTYACVFFFLLSQNQQQPTRYYNSNVEDDISTTKMINNLRNKVAELEQENSNLSKYSYSVPDLSNPTYYRRVSH